MNDFCPRYSELKREYANIQELRHRKKLSKETKEFLSTKEQHILAEMKELEEARERIEKEAQETRERICKVLQIFIKNWDKYDETDLNIVLNTVRRNNDLGEFIKNWDSLNPIDRLDPLNKIMKLDEWLESRYDINDFCQFPEALLELKEEYVSLKRADFREWTLKKFIECYKEFLCMEFRNICLYEEQTVYRYVQDKIKATRLGEYSPFTEDMMFSNFVDIAIDEDIYEDGLPEILEDDGTPNYLRPKSVLRNFGKY